ncbi:MAG: hypothetical protein II702_10240, partial [Clostridia bacterium]|nr:hypothetical protein [Clostridia bacterium]
MIKYIIILLIPWVFLFGSLAVRKVLKNKPRRAPDIRIFHIVFIFVLLSIFSLRLSIGMYSVALETGEIYGETRLSNGELFLDSIIHSLQTFSLDEDYTSYLIAGRAMAFDFTGSARFAVTAGFYLLAVDVIAPVLGGSIVLQAFFNFFPKARFWFLCRFSKRKMHIFSRINEKSLAVARSIYRKKTNEIIVFTDVYTDNENETDSEMLQNAKALGAISLKDDILHIVRMLSKAKNKTFYFINDDESENVNLLSRLSGGENCGALSHKPDIRVYYGDDTLREIQTGAYLTLKKHFDEKDMPYIIRNDSNSEMIKDVLCTYPLFGGNSYDISADTLKVSIIGNDAACVKMFLNTYWCGQLADCSLHINVCSDESRESFISRIDYINPEIAESGREGSELLKIRPDSDEKNEPYFRFGFLKADLEKCCARDLAFDSGDLLADSDYVFVSLGNDNKNISVAKAVSKEIELRHFEGTEKCVTVVCVVTDPDLNAMLNETPSYGSVSLRAVGCLTDIYDVDSFYDKKFDALYRTLDKSYSDIKERSVMINSNVEANLKRIYNTESSVARAMHLPYSIYSAFRAGGITGIDIYENGRTDIISEKALRKFFELIKDEKIDSQLAWLEHRRWNTNLRARGFRCAPSGSAKDKDFILKYHKCLVESAKNGEGKGPDMLDMLSLQAGADYKIYDYPSVIYG